MVTAAAPTLTLHRRVFFFESPITKLNEDFIRIVMKQQKVVTSIRTEQDFILYFLNKIKSQLDPKKNEYLSITNLINILARDKEALTKGLTTLELLRALAIIKEYMPRIYKEPPPLHKVVLQNGVDCYSLEGFTQDFISNMYCYIIYILPYLQEVSYNGLLSFEQVQVLNEISVCEDPFIVSRKHKEKLSKMLTVLPLNLPIKATPDPVIIKKSPTENFADFLDDNSKLNDLQKAPLKVFFGRIKKINDQEVQDAIANALFDLLAAYTEAQDIVTSPLGVYDWNNFNHHVFKYQDTLNRYKRYLDKEFHYNSQWLIGSLVGNKGVKLYQPDFNYYLGSDTLLTPRQQEAIKQLEAEIQRVISHEGIEHPNKPTVALQDAYAIREATFGLLEAYSHAHSQMETPGNTFNWAHFVATQVETYKNKLIIHPTAGQKVLKAACIVLGFVIGAILGAVVGAAISSALGYLDFGTGTVISTIAGAALGVKLGIGFAALIGAGVGTSAVLLVGRNALIRKAKQVANTLTPKPLPIERPKHSPPPIERPEGDSPV